MRAGARKAGHACRTWHLGRGYQDPFSWHLGRGHQDPFSMAVVRSRQHAILMRDRLSMMLITLLMRPAGGFVRSGRAV